MTGFRPHSGHERQRDCDRPRQAGEITGQITETEAKARKLRAALAGLDAAIAILAPDKTAYAAAERHPRRDAYFKRNELSRLVRDMLRDATRPLTAGEIAASIMPAKGFPHSAHLAITKKVVARLGALTKRGEPIKSGKSRDARWIVTPPPG
jgi:hypothetical protein